MTDAPLTRAEHIAINKLIIELLYRKSLKEWVDLFTDMMKWNSPNDVRENWLLGDSVRRSANNLRVPTPPSADKQD